MSARGIAIVQGHAEVDRNHQTCVPHSARSKAARTLQVGTRFRRATTLPYSPQLVLRMDDLVNCLEFPNASLAQCS